MFCTNCGRKISISESSCPICGAEQAKLQGGNGFWDLTEGIQKSTSKSCRCNCWDPQLTGLPPVYLCDWLPKQVTILKKQIKLPAIMAVVALVVGIVGLISTVSIKKNADDWMTGYDNDIQSFAIAEEDDRNRIAELENKNQEMELIIDAMQTELEQVKTAMATPYPEEIETDVTDEAENTAIEEVADEYTEENNAQDMIIPEETPIIESGIDTFVPDQPLSEVFGN